MSLLSPKSRKKNEKKIYQNYSVLNLKPIMNAYGK